MAMTDEQRNLLARVITDSLQGTIRLSLFEMPMLFEAAKQVAGSKEHIILGIKNWVLSDPKARELIEQAFMKAGMAFQRATENYQKNNEKPAEQVPP